MQQAILRTGRRITTVLTILVIYIIYNLTPVLICQDIEEIEDTKPDKQEKRIQKIQKLYQMRKYEKEIPALVEYDQRLIERNLENLQHVNEQTTILRLTEKKTTFFERLLNKINYIEFMPKNTRFIGAQNTFYNINLKDKIVVSGEGLAHIDLISTNYGILLPLTSYLPRLEYYDRLLEDSIQLNNTNNFSTIGIKMESTVSNLLYGGAAQIISSRTNVWISNILVYAMIDIRNSVKPKIMLSLFSDPLRLISYNKDGVMHSKLNNSGRNRFLYRNSSYYQLKMDTNVNPVANQYYLEREVVEAPLTHLVKAQKVHTCCAYYPQFFLMLGLEKKIFFSLMPNSRIYFSAYIFLTEWLSQITTRSWEMIPELFTFSVTSAISRINFSIKYINGGLSLHVKYQKHTEDSPEVLNNQYFFAIESSSVKINNAEYAIVCN